MPASWLAAVMLLALVPVSAVSAPPPTTCSIQGEPAMFKHLFSRKKKAEHIPEPAALQNAVVRSVVGDISQLYEGEWEDRDWLYLALNHEVLIEDGRRSSSQALVLAQKPGAELETLSFRLSRESKERLLALRDAMAAGGQTPWTILDLTVDRNGRYDFTFSYDPPPRLNGDLLHSPAQALVDRYLKEQK